MPWILPTLATKNHCLKTRFSQNKMPNKQERPPKRSQMQQLPRTPLPSKVAREVVAAVVVAAVEELVPVAVLVAVELVAVAAVVAADVAHHPPVADVVVPVVAAEQLVVLEAVEEEEDEEAIRPDHPLFIARGRESAHFRACMVC
eukprot:TRINITY_DN9975_c0_g1_i1.p2 TRINITY_DN9975_c0_g1~~TRINITY_DN9975_c0_g1_i1.p2  ORF type:complete len:145 (+),score=48.29 TRINITY_DN9975_c0_g1_i1:396-830(+)